MQNKKTSDMRTLIWLNHSLCAYICFKSALYSRQLMKTLHLLSQ